MFQNIFKKKTENINVDEKIGMVHSAIRNHPYFVDEFRFEHDRADTIRFLVGYAMPPEKYPYQNNADIIEFTRNYSTYSEYKLHAASYSTYVRFMPYSDQARKVLAEIIYNLFGSKKNIPGCIFIEYTGPWFD